MEVSVHERTPFITRPWDVLGVTGGGREGLNCVLPVQSSVCPVQPLKLRPWSPKSGTREHDYLETRALNRPLS